MMSRVFIVDDDPALRDALRQLLETAGLQVEAYANGASFLAACEHEQPDCVLLDMAMPGMSGYEVQASLNERDSNPATTDGIITRTEAKAALGVSTAGPLSAAQTAHCLAARPSKSR